MLPGNSGEKKSTIYQRDKGRNIRKSDSDTISETNEKLHYEVRNSNNCSDTKLSKYLNVSSTTIQVQSNRNKGGTEDFETGTQRSNPYKKEKHPRA